MQVTEYMNKVGYFQREEDYKKCIMWVGKGIIPSFIQQDYEHFKRLFKGQQHFKKGFW